MVKGLKGFRRNLQFSGCQKILQLQTGPDPTAREEPENWGGPKFTDQAVQ